MSGVVALLPDHPPRRFAWRGHAYRVVAGDGPERIHGEWWRTTREMWAVRDYFRAIGLSRTPSVSSTDASGLDPDAPPPPPGAELPLGQALTPDAARNEAGESLERTVREGYLWCGSTFLLPPLFALLIYVIYILDSDRQISRTMLLILLSFTTTPAALLPIMFVRKLGQTLEQEGLSDIRQTQGNLVIVLGFLSLALWMLCFFVLLPARS